MNSDWKTRSALSPEPSVPNETQGSSVDYLRALKRSNQGRSPDPAFPDQEEFRGSRERRRNRRYPCDGSAEIYSSENQTRVWATLTDLSRSGCYLEIHTTFPVDTVLNLALEVRGIRLEVKGVVRVSYPFLGMGMAFAEVSATNQARLDELLLLLASDSAVTPAVPAPAKLPSPSADISRTSDPQAILDALVLHFQTSSILSREEFANLLNRTFPLKP